MHYPPPIGLTECVWVEAEDDVQAAQEGADAFMSEDGQAMINPKGEVDPLDHVFVVPADDYTTFKTRLAVEPCDPEFACCGGPIRFTQTGHSGWCPKHPPQEEK